MMSRKSKVESIGKYLCQNPSFKGTLNEVLMECNVEKSDVAIWMNARMPMNVTKVIGKFQDVQEVANLIKLDFANIIFGMNEHGKWFWTDLLKGAEGPRKEKILGIVDRLKVFLWVWQRHFTNLVGPHLCSRIAEYAGGLFQITICGNESPKKIIELVRSVWICGESISFAEVPDEGTKYLSESLTKRVLEECIQDQVSAFLFWFHSLKENIADRQIRDNALARELTMMQMLPAMRLRHDSRHGLRHGFNDSRRRSSIVDIAKKGVMEELLFCKDTSVDFDYMTDEEEICLRAKLGDMCGVGDMLDENPALLQTASFQEKNLLYCACHGANPEVVRRVLMAMLTTGFVEWLDNHLEFKNMVQATSNDQVRREMNAARVKLANQRNEDLI